MKNTLSSTALLQDEYVFNIKHYEHTRTFSVDGVGESTTETKQFDSEVIRRPQTGKEIAVITCPFCQTEMRLVLFSNEAIRKSVRADRKTGWIVFFIGLVLLALGGAAILMSLCYQDESPASNEINVVITLCGLLGVMGIVPFLFSFLFFNAVLNKERGGWLKLNDLHWGRMETSSRSIFHELWQYVDESRRVSLLPPA